MKNVDLLLNSIQPKRHYSLFGKNKVIIESYRFSGIDIYYLLEHIKWMKIHNVHIETTIDIKSKVFASSDVINVFEMIMYYVAQNFCSLFKFSFRNFAYIKNLIIFKFSLLSKFNGEVINNKFIKAFDAPIFSENHYRTLVKQSTYSNQTLCVICDNVKYTIKNFVKDQKLAYDISESVVEVVGNVFEHTEADCLIDVKVAKSGPNEFYLSVNVISLTETFVGSELKKHIIIGDYDFSGSVIVQKALAYHQQNFSSYYDLDSFAFICSFQNSVSTRKNIRNTGGTGLTTLIKNIHNKSFNKEYASYMLSGMNTLYFKNEYLELDKNGLISFNDENNFFRNCPKKDILRKEDVIFPGTIFCINLITEDNHEKDRIKV